MLKLGVDPNSTQNKKYSEKEQKEIQRVAEIMKTDKMSKCNGQCCTWKPDDEKIL